MYDIVYVKQTDDLSGYDALKQVYPHTILLDGYIGLNNVMQRAKQLCYTKMYWLVTDAWHLENGDVFSWQPWKNDKLVPYYWLTSNTNKFSIGSIESFNNGVYLLPLDYAAADNIEQDVAILKGQNPSSLPFDIFFVSYNEPTADTNWALISSRFPNAKRVHGIKGIDNAHRRCAELSRSGMFWTIDADTIIHDDFDFSYEPNLSERLHLYIWHSLNPVNGLEYGWGSVKLWPTKSVLDFDGNWLDFTTTVGNIRMMPEVVATSAFNTDEWSAWRSGFRETVKLCVNVSNGDHGQSFDRLITWLTVANTVMYATDTRDGAIEGVDFYMSSVSMSDLLVINDFDKLQNIFKNRKHNLTFNIPIDQFLEKLKVHTLV